MDAAVVTVVEEIAGEIAEAIAAATDPVVTVVEGADVEVLAAGARAPPSMSTTKRPSPRWLKGVPGK